MNEWWHTSEWVIWHTSHTNPNTHAHTHTHTHTHTSHTNPYTTHTHTHTHRTQIHLDTHTHTHRTHISPTNTSLHTLFTLEILFSFFSLKRQLASQLAIQNDFLCMYIHTYTCTHTRTHTHTHTCQPYEHKPRHSIYCISREELHLLYGMTFYICIYIHTHIYTHTHVSPMNTSLDTLFTPSPAKNSILYCLPKLSKFLYVWYIIVLKLIIIVLSSVILIQSPAEKSMTNSSK